MIRSWKYRDRREINLTTKEYDLLCLLAANRGQVFTYDQIYRKVWGEDAYGDESNAIGCHIRHLREKLYEEEKINRRNRTAFQQLSGSLNVNTFCQDVLVSAGDGREISEVVVLGAIRQGF